MSNISGQTTKKLYQQLVERDGEVCSFCCNGTEIRQLVIVKKNKSKEYKIENLELYCKRCNSFRKSAQSGDISVSSEETSLSVNREKEPKFRKWVYKLLSKSKYVDRKILVNDGAEKFELSPTTTKRYLEKICSGVGLCMMVIGNVTFDMDHPLFKEEIEEYDGVGKSHS